jgi:hypothetical protein
MGNGAAVEDVLRELARETGRTLAEIGVRPTDRKWIREHARTIASLCETRKPGGLAGFFRRLRRR